MAYNKTNKKLYVTEDSGITLWEIAQCLQYYKTDTKGNRDLGLMVERANINKWAKHKPLEYDTPLIPQEKWEDYRKGIDGSGRHGGLFTDATGATANNLQALFLENGWNHLEYRRPTGAFYKRILDFDGYIHTPPLWGNKLIGDMENPYSVIYMSGRYLGGYLQFSLALGSCSDDFLNGEDVIRSIGQYAGFLIVRPSKTGSWDQRLQYDNKDYMIVTTEQPIFEYRAGTTVDSNAMVQVGNNYPDMINFSFPIPTNSDMDNRLNFDDWVGETIEAYPIMSHEPIFFLSNYNPEARITRLAAADGTWNHLTFVLEEASSNIYIAPTISTFFDIEVIGTIYRYTNVSVEVVANHPYNADYIVSLNSITGMLYKRNDITGEWQEYSGASIPDFSGSAMVSYKGQRATISYPQASTFEMTLPVGVYKVILHANGSVEYNGTKPIIGAETEKFFAIQ